MSYPGEKPMGNENMRNRETSMTPELIATINAAVGEGVKGAISGLFAELAPLLRDLNKPYVDPAVERKKLRDKMKFKADEVQNEKDKQALREKCPHKYSRNGN